jgi:hypothetical protein
MNTFPAITVDDSLWPLVLCRFEGTPSLPEFEGYLRKRAGLLQRGPHLLLVDGMNTGMKPPSQRQRLVEWMGQHEALLRERLLGIAYATNSDQMRLTLSIIFHLRPPVSPYVIFSRMEQAVGWVVHKLEEAGQHEAAERVRYQPGLLLERRSSEKHLAG